MRPGIINTIIHVAGWLAFFSLVTGFVHGSPGRYSLADWLLSLPFLVFCFIYVALFYVNAYILVPPFYLQKKYVLYIIIILLLFAAVYFIKPFDDLIRHTTDPGNRPLFPPEENAMRRPPEGPRQNDIISIILFVTVWSLSTALCIIRQWRMTAERALRAEGDKLAAEFSFLKAQINPHFLFNTLNNIYSLSVTKNENTAASIMKLSSIMRYVTDEVREDFVPLQSEVDCMSDYIDLQRMRLGDKMNVQYSLSGNTGDKKIAPLILITFVENVFKYGISSHEPSDITIKLVAEEHAITFFCQNRLFETKKNAERTGIGIENTSRRLKHLYPDKHFLSIDTGNGQFTVQLTLQA